MANNETRPWEAYLPTHVNLYYVDYCDNLDEHMNLLQECVEKNSKYPLSETVYDFWDDPEGPYLDEMRKAMERDGIEWDDEWVDEIRERLWDLDESDPVDDLLKNTISPNFYYSTSVEVDGWHEAFLCAPWRGESEAQAITKICRFFGIKKDDPRAKQVKSLVLNAPYGGELRLYFQAPLDTVLSAEYQENAPDFKSVHFNGDVAVALYDPLNGSGDFEIMKIDKWLYFDRENLAISDCDRYSIEETFGMSYDWARSTDVPEFSLKANGTRGPKKVSAAAERRRQEAKYIQVFKAGGCTLGDTDFRRHRDVYYDNSVPCGNRCPHCGQFWID